MTPPDLSAEAREMAARLKQLNIRVVREAVALLERIASRPEVVEATDEEVMATVEIVSRSRRFDDVRRELASRGLRLIRAEPSAEGV